MQFLTRSLPFIAGFLPVFVFAQGDFGGIEDFAENITEFINNTVVPLVFAIAFIMFLWGVAKYFIIAGDDNEGARKEGRQYMLWSILGFVVMVSIWGIVNLLSDGFGFADQNIQNIPNAPTRNN